MKNIVLQEVTKIIIPFIQVFSLYVIFNGHISPGGGFAGGTILGSSLILSRVIYGKKIMDKKYSFNRLLKLMCGGLIFYGVLKGYVFITGGSHIHGFSISLGTPGEILSGGYLLPLNITVGVIVGITIYFLFSLFNEGEV